MAIMYPIIKDYIVNSIKDGTFKEGTMLPPEKVFTTKFSVSRMTVRRAFDELIRDGILIRKKGHSVYVARKKIHRSISRLSISSDKEMMQEFGPIRVEVLGLKIVKDHPVANELLKVKPDQEIWQLKRVQLGWDIPLVYEVVYFPKAYFKDFTKEDCQQSLAKFFPLKLKEKMTITNKVEVNAMLATPDIAKLLHMDHNGPVLQIDNICCDEKGNIIYCGRDYYDGNIFKYCEK